VARLPDPTGALDEEGRAVWDRLRERRAGRGARLPGLYLTLMHHPALTEHVEGLGDYLRYGGVLPRDVYEFVVLAVGHKTGSEYEWGQHEELARVAGVPEEAITALRTEHTPPEPYGTIETAVDVLLARRRLRERLQDRLLSLVGSDGLVELAVLVGYYAALAGVLTGFEVTFDDDERVDA
jgi:alkylhydroperoxidase family enzyme